METHRRLHSFRLTVLALAGAISAAGSPTPAQTAQPDARPVAVSPGSATGSMIGDSCPTFSWGTVPGATSYELVLYRVEDDSEEAKPVLQRSFPGSVNGWTPSLDSCLQPGGKYAWNVRAGGTGKASQWSPLSIFRVAAPSQAEFEEAVAVVRQYLATGKPAPAVSAELPEAPAGTAREVVAGAPSLLAPLAATQLAVDGNVDATSFSGDGSRLTGIPTVNDLCQVYYAAGTTPLPDPCKYYAFLSFPAHSGDLVSTANNSFGGAFGLADGLEAGDWICQSNADSGGLTGVYKAWLSGSSTNAIDRLEDPPTPWVGRNGETTIADDKADLTNCAPDCLGRRIFFLNGSAVGVLVHTDTLATGLRSAALNCADWTNGTASQQNLLGDSNSVGIGWTEAVVAPCDLPGHLYCFRTQ